MLKTIQKVLKHRPDCPDLSLNHLHCLSVMAFPLHIGDDCTLFGKDSLCYCTAHTSNCPLASLVLSMRGWGVNLNRIDGTINYIDHQINQPISYVRKSKENKLIPSKKCLVITKITKIYQFKGICYTQKKNGEERALSTYDVETYLSLLNHRAQIPAQRVDEQAVSK